MIIYVSAGLVDHYILEQPRKKMGFPSVSEYPVNII
jgi:hypothetical protein